MEAGILVRNVKHSATHPLCSIRCRNGVMEKFPVCYKRKKVGKIIGKEVIESTAVEFYSFMTRTSVPSYRFEPPPYSEVLSVSVTYR